MNAFDEVPVAIRPMVREDVEALSRWARHTDPRYRAYDVGPLSREEGDALWHALSEPAGVREPYVAVSGGEVVAQLVLRDIRRDAGTAELGIMIDPARIGQGLGRRILRAFAGYCAENGYRRLTLEVAADNERAIRAYQAAGFVTRGERRGAASPGAGSTRILRMETELSAPAFTDSESCQPESTSSP